jgi:hypothetical protein
VRRSQENFLHCRFHHFIRWRSQRLQQQETFFHQAASSPGYIRMLLLLLTDKPCHVCVFVFQIFTMIHVPSLVDLAYRWTGNNHVTLIFSFPLAGCITLFLCCLSKDITLAYMSLITYVRFVTINSPFFLPFQPGHDLFCYQQGNGFPTKFVHSFLNKKYNNYCDLLHSRIQ